jgi:adenosine deaminase
VEALEVLGARRIGHGVAVARDEALAARIAAEGVVLECCLTSNLQTAAVSSLGGHPFDRLLRAGHAVTLNTDDPAVSGITLSGEFALAAETWGLSAQDLSKLTCTAAGAAFLEPAARARLQDRVKNKWPRT